MSEPWAHPERANANEPPAPDQISPLTEPDVPVQSAPQQTFQYESSPPQYPHHEFPSPESSAHLSPQYAGAGPVSPLVAEKKSGLLGLIGLLVVIAANLALVIAVTVGFSNIEYTDNYINELAQTNSTGTIILSIAIVLWLLGSLLCFIALTARRGVVTGAIGMVLVILPSWIAGLVALLAAAGSAVIVNSLTG